MYVQQTIESRKNIMQEINDSRNQLYITFREADLCQLIIRRCRFIYMVNNCVEISL